MSRVPRVSRRVALAAWRAWGWLRAACGDDAYERYLEHCAAHHPQRVPLGRREFCREAERRRWSGVSRCC